MTCIAGELDKIVLKSNDKDQNPFFMNIQKNISKIDVFKLQYPLLYSAHLTISEIDDAVGCLNPFLSQVYPKEINISTSSLNRLMFIEASLMAMINSRSQGSFLFKLNISTFLSLIEIFISLSDRRD